VAHRGAAAPQARAGSCSGRLDGTAVQDVARLAFRDEVQAPPGQAPGRALDGNRIVPSLWETAWVDVRDSGNLVLASARRWLAGVNARYPWNHNEHFHRWILRSLPAGRRADYAVDVGCGTGVLAGRPAPHFARVIGIDSDEGMAAAASAHLADIPRVRIVRCGFAEFAQAAGAANILRCRRPFAGCACPHACMRAPAEGPVRSWAAARSRR
jgi:Methyltransferase domain